MLAKLSFITIAAFAVAALSPAGDSRSKKPYDPNEKVCETIKPVGSRLATKRVCATRAEWAEQRKQDREETEKAQRLGCLTQDACGGF